VQDFSENRGSPDWLAAWAGQVFLKAKRVERLGERSLGVFRLDRPTIVELGSEQRGVLVTRCEEDQVIVGILRKFETCDAASSGFLWVFMADIKDRAIDVKRHWLYPTALLPGDAPKLTASEGARTWQSSRFLHGTIEAIGRHRSQDALQPIAALFLLDPLAHVHQARGGFRSGHFHVPHDRPQLVVDLRRELGNGQWSPPLIIFTQKEPRSVQVDAMKRAYCLDAFVFLDGRTLMVSR
jgi:hypothetical protein